MDITDDEYLKLAKSKGDCIKCGKPDTSCVAVFNSKPQFICAACLQPGGITGYEIVDHGTTGAKPEPRTYTSWGSKQGRAASHWGVKVDLDKPTTGVVQNNHVEFLYEDADQGIDLAWEEHLAECRGQCSKCHCNHDSPPVPDEGAEPDNGKCECYRATPGHAYDPSDDHDGCGPEEQGTVLAGSWVKVYPPGHPEHTTLDAWGKRIFEVGSKPNLYGYVPDREGEYAAIVGEIYAQVVWSKRVVRVRSLCSPCFPGQADVDPEKIVTEKVCPYHEDSKTWSDCTEGFEGCMYAKDAEGYLAFDLPKDMYGAEE